MTAILRPGDRIHLHVADFSSAKEIQKWYEGQGIEVGILTAGGGVNVPPVVVSVIPRSEKVVERAYPVASFAPDRSDRSDG